MRHLRLPILALLAIFSLQPALAATHKHGLGAAVVSGVVDCEDSCVDQFEFTGFALFGKIGFTDNWGLLITYRDMEDDEELLLNEEDTYTQLAVQAVYMWRPAKVMRPHIKFGLESTDFETKIPDFTVVELFDEDFTIGNLDLGNIFKF